MRRHPSLLALFAVLTQACGGGESPVTPPPGGGGGVGSFTITSSAASTSVAAGATQTLTITVSRTAPFVGAVSLVASGLPAGVTATFNPSQVASGSTTSTLTIGATAASAAGTTTINIVGAASGVSSASTGVAVTVTAPPANALFTISPSVTGFQLPATNTTVNFHLPTIAITRNAGYTGAISFSLTGLPATMVAGINPASTTANSANMLFINGGVPNGTYTGTIRAVGANGGGERTATISVIVAAPTAGNVTWSHCTSDQKLPAHFVAVKDGTGPWTRVVAGNDGYRYSFNVSSPTASVAFVSVDSGVARTTVYNYTQQELITLGISQCSMQPPATTRTMTGTVTGLANGQLAMQSMGWWFASNIGTGTQTYSLQNLPTGPLDLVGFRSNTESDFNLLPTHFILRRGFDPAAGASAPVMDYNSAEAAFMSPSRWIIGNTTGEAFTLFQYFHTGGGTAAQFYPVQVENTNVSRTVTSIPTARTIAADVHQTILTTASLTPKRPSRQVITYQRSIVDRTLDFGPAMPAPTVTSVSANGAGMIRAVGTLPTEYAAGVTMDVKSTGAFPRFATVHTSRGFLGAGTAYDVRMPDLTGAFGWDTNWNMRPGDVTEWWVSGGGPILDFAEGRYMQGSFRRRWAGILTGIELPVDGNTYRMARVFGTITP